MAYRKIGTFVKQINEKNNDGEYTDVLGVSIEKEFMPSVANTIGTDLRKYYVLRRNRFAFNPMHVGRDKKLPIAVYHEDEPALVSPAYSMFEVIDNSINIKYLMLLFKTTMFDHICWFYTDGSVRGGLSWEDFCNIEIDIPSMDEQKRLVDKFNGIKNIIDVKKETIIKLEELAYMQYTKLLEDNGEINSLKLKEICKISAGGDNPGDVIEKKDDKHKIPVYSNGTKNDGLFGYTCKEKIKENSVTVSARGAIGYTVYHNEPYFPIVRLISITPNDCIYTEYLYYVLKNNIYTENGTSQQQVTIPYFEQMDVLIPSEEKLKVFHKNIKPILYNIITNKKIIDRLEELKCSIILSIEK